MKIPRSVAKAVMIGDYDAGAVKENTLCRVNSHGGLRVIHSFENVTKPWIARSDVDDGVVRQLRQALLKLNNPEALAALKIDGFLPASDEDYELVVSGMEIANAF
jgi:phosphonate transport system substrate-binding protein